jgi:son of sevenless-like protein
MEKLILQLLGLLCARPPPHSVQEIQDRIQKMFPPPIDKWAIDEATSAIRQGKRRAAEMVFPVEKIHSLLQKVRRISSQINA